MTYVGANGNGSVSIMWGVSVVTSSPYDVNQDGYINNADLEVISAHFGEVTAAPYPRYDVIGYGIVDVYDIIAVSTNILSERESCAGILGGNMGAASGWRVRYFKILIISGTYWSRIFIIIK